MRKNWRYIILWIGLIVIVVVTLGFGWPARRC
jgi:hypothetical protein